MHLTKTVVKASRREQTCLRLMQAETPDVWLLGGCMAKMATDRTAPIESRHPLVFDRSPAELDPATRSNGLGSKTTPELRTTITTCTGKVEFVVHVIGRVGLRGGVGSCGVRFPPWRATALQAPRRATVVSGRGAEHPKKPPLSLTRFEMATATGELM